MNAMTDPKPELKVRLLDGRWAVCRLDADEPVPRLSFEGGFASITRTDNETSVVCLEEAAPEGARVERGWRCLALRGPLIFDEVGVLVALAQPLAEAGISIFTVSTFDTDHILIRDPDLSAAIEALEAAGFEVE